MLVAVADVPRRRAGLEAVVAGLSEGPMPVTSWGALAAHPELAEGFDHLVALDPPPGGIGDPLLRSVPRAHLAWGPAEAEFAITAWRAELDLRPQLTEIYRALRELPPDAAAADVETALRGAGRYPRNARACARLARVLAELSLIELDPAGPDLSRPRRGPKRAGALTDLPRQPRRAGRRSNAPWRPSCLAGSKQPRPASRLAALGVDVEVVDEPGAEAHRAHPELDRRVLARQQREQVGDHPELRARLPLPGGQQRRRTERPP